MTSAPAAVRIVVADDHHVVRTGFAALLDTQPDFAVVGTACDGTEAVQVCRELSPDVVLMDVRMPVMDGIEATRQLAGTRPDGSPGPRILILTTFDLDRYVYDALCAGASGFLLKDVTAERLFEAVRVIAAGEALLAPAVTRRLISEFTRLRPRPEAPATGALATLTPRETQVLRLVAEGLSNPEIAARLFVTEETVKSHVSRMLTKLGLRDRTQAVVTAYELGLVVPGSRDPGPSPGLSLGGHAMIGGMTVSGDGRVFAINGISLYIEDHGEGIPVLMIHGWPDSARLWRHQVPHLVSHGYRVITPDLRGMGRSARPTAVAAYGLRHAVADMTAILDECGIGAAHVVGHDWGAVVAWLMAALSPDRVRTLTAISVSHPRSAQTLRSYEMAWYQLFFQFEGIAEATLQHDDWAWLRWFSRGDGDQEQWIADLSQPGALTASLNWYRANLAPRLPGPAPELPPVTAPTMGIWSTGDHYLDGERMRSSASLVTGPWRYEEIPDASHWVPLDAPGRLNELLLEWLR